MARRGDWSAYAHPEYQFTAFPPGARVADVGCGWGEQLEELRSRRCVAVGTELDDDSIGRCRARGLPVLKAVAEALPFADVSLDGLIVKGVLMYTNEDHAFGEFARVLKPGGRLEALYLGVGYYLRYLLLGPGKYRVYGLRTLANTPLYRLTGRRLPGWLGDTVYQTRDLVARFYARHGFALARDTPSPAFLGLPVFIYHTLVRRGGA